jgi:hypothetical protein
MNLNLILLFATAMEIHYLFVPIESKEPEKEKKEEKEEPDYFKELNTYEKIQLSLLEYDLTMMYGSTYVQQYYKF